MTTPAAALLFNGFPKAPSAAQTLGSFNPTGSRRSYDSPGSSGSPNYHDTPTLPAWPGNAYSGLDYKLQGRLVADRLEGINGVTGCHSYQMRIAGTPVSTIIDNSPDSGWVDISNGLTGTVDFYDWSTVSGGTAFVGNVTIQYRYVSLR